MKSIFKSIAFLVLTVIGSSIAHGQICSPPSNQFANPQITTANPKLNMVRGTTYPVLFRFANTGNPDIVPANSLEIVITLPDNVKMEFQPPYIVGTPCGIWTIDQAGVDFIILHNTGGATSFSTSCDIQFYVKAKQTNVLETYSVAVNRLPGRTSCVGDTDPSSSNNTKDAQLLATSNPLPVKLQSFTASAKECSAQLSWQTATEQSFKQFEVEYSNDGSEFSTVGKVESKGQAAGSKYTFEFAQPSGKGYYRLAMLDVDGTTSYSTVTSVATHCNNSKIMVFPNPSKDFVKVSGLESGSVIKVYNVTGSLVKEISTTSDFEVINIAAWVSGNYQLQVISGNGSMTDNFRITKL